jgi:cytochrome c-type biogenesis protein CcmH
MNTAAWIPCSIAALVCVLIALAFMSSRLLRKRDTTVRAAGRSPDYVLARAFPVAVIGLVFWLGNPEAIANTDSPPPQQVQAGQDIMQLIQQVEEKTRQDPDDAQAWGLLAKTYASVGHWPEALQAYEKAFKLRPDVASVMTGYAEALAIGNNRVLAGKPIELVLQALEKDPGDIKGLELAGVHAFQEKGYAKAAFYMKQLYKQLPPESPYARDILAAQKEAESLLKSGLTGMDDLSAPAVADDKSAVSGGAFIRGRVEISPELKARVTDKDTIFLYARSAGGVAPVAAIRTTAGEFPLEFVLDDSMAMNPESRLSRFKEVSLVARVSKSGNLKGAAGDFEGKLDNVKVGASGVLLTIDKVRP